MNAFAVDWKGENNWVVPPFSSITAVLSHIKKCEASGSYLEKKISFADAEMKQL